MKPVAIFRHSPGEGPGYFATFLESRSVPWRLLAVDAGEPIPADPGAFSGLAFMGGPMSVNDPLPWVEEECALIRTAVARNIPVIGHCLGGQLMSRALGGVVTKNPAKEIGWGEVTVADNNAARAWLGDLGAFLSFHWHGETFSIPREATPILGSALCANQAFALGPHLGMQCHVEMTAEMIRQWNTHWDAEAKGQPGPGVQTPEEMYVELEPRLAALHAAADRLYTKWAEGLAA